MQFFTKLSLNDTCYFMYNNKVKSMPINKILVEVKPGSTVRIDDNLVSHDVDVTYVVPNGKDSHVKEKDAFKTKAELLESL